MAVTLTINIREKVEEEGRGGEEGQRGGERIGRIQRRRRGKG